MPQRFDYIIVGSGIAGLYAALLAREHGSVCVLTKGSIDECNTKYAQGGIAAAVGSDDNAELHLRDTLEAGAGLVNEEAARILVEAAPDRISDLVTFGVPFDSTDGEVALGREAAHSRNRILHAGGDSTGAYIELSLSGLAKMSRITIKEYVQVEEIVVEEGRATGLIGLDTRTNTSERFDAGAIVLATGGCGQLFRVSTNPEVATGDGVALAYRAGAEVRDMEFIQFHPTALRLPGVPIFLISEAVRGEGAVLKNAAGERFMPSYHEKAELAPRDVVARAIVSEMSRMGTDRVYLDITHLPASKITARFPQIYRYCKDHGLDMTRDAIPVSPAAHYIMGGVRTNTWGETTLPGLYACGEVACTGVHGANRLASNSLLETVVFAKRIVQRTLESPGTCAVPSADARELPPFDNESGSTPDRPSLQALMWDKVGIVRDGDGLRAATRQLTAWRAALPQPHDRPSHELANMLLAGRLMAEGALVREESRGAHYRTDYPEPRDEWRRHITFRRRI
jgi:L-aspartate oxidase